MRPPIALPIHATRMPLPHSVRDMLRQRVYGLVQGWEDLNDHTQLRADVAYQTAVGRDDELASAPTLCRLEKLGTAGGVDSTLRECSCSLRLLIISSRAASSL